jgi:hypothetical protein
VTDLERALDDRDLLRPDALVRIPHLVRGELVAPPPISLDDARAAIGENDYARVGGAQIVSERLIDRATMEQRRQKRLLIMPDIDPTALLVRDPGATRAALTAISFDSLVEWLDRTSRALVALTPRLRAILHAVSDLADPFLDMALGLGSSMFAASAVREIVDRELAFGAIAGSALLDGWVEVDASTFGGATSMFGGGAAMPPRVRAMPTLQLHVTAGNAPIVVPTSALRALCTASAPIVKLPSGALAPGGVLAAALWGARTNAITALLDATSLVYWKGGDDRVERVLFDPSVLDRVVVWGAPDAVERTSELARSIRTVMFMPRYGVGLVGREIFDDEAALKRAAACAAADVLVWNQRACTAQMVCYVEANEREIERFAIALRDALAACDEVAPGAPSREALGRIRRLRRGSLTGARWLSVGDPTSPRAAVVVLPGPFELSEHPLSRVAMVRRVDDLSEAIALLHRGVSTAGVYPEARRTMLRDEIAARGVSNVVPLGSAERGWPGMPHDGMRVLSELVDWVNA